ncbi:asialoglycoprotein receptor 1-like isoform X2 [Sceloporus undulatus]|uniref:asialoglycoprotein receptor 1-like isoform X2 n=1 Tax=Sceloporus undulatus TaxID=8520 RepID=UPI001C4CC9A2|nr:asialoglycoprotein receptor 1-like isoform X2 [Sceloporus undulatus]
MATSVDNSDALDVQPSTAVDYQDLRSLDVGEEGAKHFGKGFPSPQSSWRRVCPTNRLVLALIAACGILTLSVVVLGFQGVQLNAEKWGTTKALNSFNQTVWTGLSSLQNKRNSTGWRLTSLGKLLMAHSVKMKKANDLFQEQLENLQQDSRSFSCDLVEMRSNGTKSGCCPKDWQIFQESCYWMSRSTLSWENAKSNCERKNAHLVIFNSPEEKRFINQRKRSGYTWIGLTDVSGAWKWVDGSTYTFRKNDWVENQPDHWYGHGLGGGEDCVHMYSSGLWNDNHCSRSFYWICEMELKF